RSTYTRHAYLGFVVDENPRQIARLEESTYDGTGAVGTESQTPVGRTYYVYIVGIGATIFNHAGRLNLPWLSSQTLRIGYSWRIVAAIATIVRVGRAWVVLFTGSKSQSAHQGKKHGFVDEFHVLKI